ncbi:RabGAP/TBC [Aureobasidium pullulans]|nr:RabGAP/TBC [Aureobasidium pullulans]
MAHNTMHETPPLHTSGSSNDLKRDSGIAKATLTSSPSVPSIIVHDAITASPPNKTTKRTPPFLRRKSKPIDEDDADVDESEEDFSEQPELPRSNSAHSRIRSFHGIDMEIPTTSGFDELTSPDSFKFSTRGSILLNSKKLANMMRAHDGDMTDGDATDNDFHTAPNSPTFSPPMQAPPSPPLSPTPTSPKPNPKRLTTGPRTPSVHMLNAVLDGRRVLSAEERTFSHKVRSMYKYGDERAADWNIPMEREETPEPPAGVSRSLTNPRRRPVTSRSARPQDPHDRFSFIQNEHECAGGVEDWEDLSGKDVDRYGFINPTKFISTEGPQNGSVKPSLQRVTTSLQLLSSSPRRRRGLIRGPSTARSSRSLPPPTRTNTRTTVGSSPSGHAASIYSFQSGHSQHRSHNPFRSRDRKLLDDASDMLTLPACLDNLAEEDAHENFLRRREIQREEKWRKMARLMPQGLRGGGMNFDFDVTDPKLVARTWKGVPDKWRATAWHAFLSASAKRRGGCQTDDELIEIFHELQEESSADDVQIDVDVPRTISMHIMFRRRYRGGQRLLFRVLHAISVHFPSTGYVQGMASLAATLLCYYDEEHTFIMLVRMWELRGLKILYEHGFSGLMTTLKEFENDWLANDPDLKAKLDDFGIDAMTYGTKWYLTLFNLSMPFPAQLRVWDVFMLLGDADFPGNPPPTRESKATFDGADLSVLHATSAALVDATKSLIVDGDFENAMKVLTSWVPVRDEDMLMRVAKAEWKIHMKNRRHASS